MKIAKKTGIHYVKDVDVANISKKNDALMEKYVLREGSFPEYLENGCSLRYFNKSILLVPFPLLSLPAPTEIFGTVEERKIKNPHKEWLYPDMIRPELLEGYLEDLESLDFDFDQPFVAKEPFHLVRRSQEGSPASPDFLRYGDYLVDQNDAVYNLQDLVSASLFKKYLRGENVEREFALEEVIDARNQENKRIFEGTIRDGRIAPGLGTLNKAGSSYLTAFTTSVPSDGEVTPSFSLLFYLSEKKNAMDDEWGSRLVDAYGLRQGAPSSGPIDSLAFIFKNDY